MSSLISTTNSASGNGIIHLTDGVTSKTSMETDANLPNTLYNSYLSDTIKVVSTEEYTLGSSFISWEPNFLSGGPDKWVPVPGMTSPFTYGGGVLISLYCPALTTHANLMGYTYSYTELGAPDQAMVTSNLFYVGVGQIQGGTGMYISFNTADPTALNIFNNRNGCKVKVFHLDYTFSGTSVVFDHTKRTVFDIEISDDVYVNNSSVFGTNECLAARVSGGYQFDGLTHIGRYSYINLTQSNGQSLVPGSNSFAIGNSYFPLTVNKTNPSFEIKSDYIKAAYNDGIYSFVGKMGTDSLKYNYESWSMLNPGQSLVCSGSYTLLVSVWNTDSNYSYATKILGSDSSDGITSLFKVTVAGPSVSYSTNISKLGNTFTYNQVTGGTSLNIKCVIFRYTH